MKVIEPMRARFVWFSTLHPRGWNHIFCDCAQTWWVINSPFEALILVCICGLFAPFLRCQVYVSHLGRCRHIRVKTRNCVLTWWAYVPSFYGLIISVYTSDSLKFYLNRSTPCLFAPTSRFLGESMYGALCLAPSAYSSRLMDLW